jgi:hypothetical protein
MLRKYHKNKQLDFLFEKNMYRGAFGCAIFGAIGLIFFMAKLIISESKPDFLFEKEDLIGLFAGFFLFILFYPLSWLLYFTNAIGKDFFMKKDEI